MHLSSLVVIALASVAHPTVKATPAQESAVLNVPNSPFYAAVRGLLLYLSRLRCHNSSIQAQYCADKTVAAVFAIVSAFHAVPGAAINTPDVVAFIEQQPLAAESASVNKKAPWCEPVLFHTQGCSDPLFGHNRTLARLAQKDVLHPGAPGMGTSDTSQDWTYPLIDLTTQAAKPPVFVSHVSANSPRMA
jgi:hypothetical protein